MRLCSRAAAMYSEYPLTWSTCWRDRRMILGAGSTGRIGRPLIRELVRRGAAVRALLHRAANRPLLPTKGLQVLVGDLRDPATIDAAFAGVDTVFVLSPVGPDLVTTESALIAAC